MLRQSKFDKCHCERSEAISEIASSLPLLAMTFIHQKKIDAALVDFASLDFLFSRTELVVDPLSNLSHRPVGHVGVMAQLGGALRMLEALVDQAQGFKFTALQEGHEFLKGDVTQRLFLDPGQPGRGGSKPAAPQVYLACGEQVSQGFAVIPSLHIPPPLTGEGWGEGVMVILLLPTPSHQGLCITHIS